MSSKRVCILGGSGFVGAHLTARLSRQGFACRIITRNPHRHRHLAVNPGTQIVGSNLFDEQSLTRQFKDCDGVINLIGILNEEKGADFRRYHVELVDLIVNACRKAGITRLLHMSALQANEASGSSRYLRTKGEGENRAHTLGSASIGVTSFRPSVIFGPGDHLFNRFGTLLKRTPLLPLACPEARFAPVFVGDVAEAFARSLNDPKTFGKHFDLCGPEVFTLRELVEFTAHTLRLRRTILSLGDASSRLLAKFSGHLPGTPFTYDNYLSLQNDSICANNGLETLGIKPQSIGALVPLYLSGSALRQRYANYRKLSNSEN